MFVARALLVLVTCATAATAACPRPPASEPATSPSPSPSSPSPSPSSPSPSPSPTSMPHAAFDACALGEKLDERFGFKTQKPGVSTLHPATHAGVSGSATVEHDGDMRIRRCIFQAMARGQDASRSAAERFAQELRRAEWTLLREDTAPDYVAGGRMQTFTKGDACRFVFWGCSLAADDCAATLAHADCPPR